MNKFFAQPYDQSATGFYFTDFADYEAQAAALTNSYGQPVEEFEIQFIDGPDAELFNACGVDQSNLEQWFDDVEDLDDHHKIALFYLMDNNVVADIDTALGKFDDVMFEEGDLSQAAEVMFDDLYLHEIPDHLHNYINYEAFARDLECGGDAVEFDFNGTTYTVTNANSI